MDVDIMTLIRGEARPQGTVRRNLGWYSSGMPGWRALGFVDDRQRGVIDSTLAGLIALAAVCVFLLLRWPA
jgi:hypothetical protein